MVYWERTRTYEGLIQAVRQNYDLPQEEWDRLYAAATPYQRRCADLIRDPTAAPHGKEATYVNWGCRCEDCREAATAARAARRAATLQQDFHTDAPEPGSSTIPGDDTPVLGSSGKTQLQIAMAARDAGNPTQKALDYIAEWEARQVI